MTGQKMTTLDNELGLLLREHDPAAAVSPLDCARLEMAIAARIVRQPQASPVGNLSDDFLVPRLLTGGVSFPATLMSLMALGLMLGFFVASLAGTAPPATKYTITTAMAEPWHQFLP